MCKFEHKKIRNNWKFIVFVADVVRAREELDGLRQPSRPFNPLTIIQVRVCEKNELQTVTEKKFTFPDVSHIPRGYKLCRLKIGDF